MRTRSIIGLALAAAGLPTPASRAADVATAAYAPTTTVRYGPAAEQHVDLFLPKGPGPFPVMVFLHGGCWRASSAAASAYWPALAAFAARGVAVWSVAYRRVDEPGGAYPGMFADVAAGTDRLASDATRYNLDLTRLIYAGHSAGGHLALWDAGRARLPSASPLAGASPLHPRAVVNLAGPGVVSAHPQDMDKVCGAGTAAGLLGVPTAARPDIFTDTVPARLLPLGVRTVQFTGSADDTVPSAAVIAYDRLAAKAGEAIETHVESGASHNALVDPRTRAFADVAATVGALLGAAAAAAAGQPNTP